MEPSSVFLVVALWSCPVTTTLKKRKEKKKRAESFDKQTFFWLICQIHVSVSVSQGGPFSHNHLMR